MHSKSKTMSLLILVLTLVLALGAFAFGASRTQASALEETAQAAPSEEAAPADAEGEEGGTCFAVLYIVADGVTSPTLIGLHASDGWEMALWLTLVFWCLAAVASILAVLLAKIFIGKDPEKPFNTIALLGFIWSIFMPAAGLVLSFLGKRRADRYEGGKLYYVGGFIVSGVAVGIAVILAIAHACAPFLPF